VPPHRGGRRGRCAAGGLPGVVPARLPVLDLVAHARAERAAVRGALRRVRRAAERRDAADRPRGARTWVCIGINEREGGTLYNTLAWFDADGRLVARHRKLQPTNAERTIWGRGDGRDVFVLDTELGRLGGLICFEHAMDLNRYALAALGQQVHVSAWPAISAMTADPNSGNFDNLTETAIKYHAMAAQVYVVCVQSRIDEGAIEHIGLTGQPDKIRVGGGLSAIVAPNATYVAGPHRDDEAILYGEIDLGMIPFAKFFADSAGHYARPDVFSFGIDQRPQTALTGAPDGAVDRTHILGGPDDGEEVIEGTHEPRLLAPPPVAG
jgi:nitrilase